MYNILLADDHTIVRQGIKRIIEEVQNYMVIGEVGDGLQILPKVKELHPDIIILDISMPKLRGIEAVSEIKKIDEDIKILILTVHKNEEYVYECLSSGANGYILKEDAAKELIFAIDSIKQNKIYISSNFRSDVILDLIKRKGDLRDKSSIELLTNREREVLKLIAEGYANKRIAKLLSISVRTVERHRSNIMKKLNVSNVVELVKYALKLGLVDLD
jgi:DNA-binding NarL/FixJ family response regulator